jgi:hypothetical protein
VQATGFRGVLVKVHQTKTCHKPSHVGLRLRLEQEIRKSVKSFLLRVPFFDQRLGASTGAGILLNISPPHQLIMVLPPTNTCFGVRA